MRVRKLRQWKRRGNIVVLTAVLMVAMMALLALSIDAGYLLVARSQTQRAADSAAMAAAWELAGGTIADSDQDDDIQQMKDNARSEAQQFASLNEIFKNAPQLAASDVEIGYLENPNDPHATINTSSSERPNAVRVQVRRTSDQNGEVPLFFARALGLHEKAIRAEATAVLVNSVRGFRTPPDNSSLGILPFALDEESWNQLMAGVGQDEWTWNDDLKAVQPGGDGILEVNMYPQDTGSPGNRGTVDIGSNNNSTSDLRRQIREGISAADLAFHGGSLEFGPDGKLYLGADPGISAGMKDALTDVIGRPSVVPLFVEVTGSGNNGVYTIVKWVGVRVLEVNLTGKNGNKRVMVQPAPVVMKGVIRSEPGATVGSTSSNTTSDNISSTVWLLR